MSSDKTDPPSFPADNITDSVFNVSQRPVKYGGVADVYTGDWNGPNGSAEKVALKVIRVANPHDDKMKRRLQREIRVWNRLSHPNILCIHGLYVGIGYFPAMVSPWCENGDINDYVQARADDPKLDEIKLDLLVNVLEGLQYLHQNHIIHADLKGNNVLISNAGVAQLADFGFSTILAEYSQSLTQYTSIKGTSRWMAPELFLDDDPRHSVATDIWAFGCLSAEVFTGELPYRNCRSDNQVMIAIMKHELPFQFDSDDPRWIVVEDCCKIERDLRASVDILLQRFHILQLCNAIELEKLYEKTSRDSSSTVLGASFQGTLETSNPTLDPDVTAVLTALQTGPHENPEMEMVRRRTINHVLNLCGTLAGSDRSIANTPRGNALLAIATPLVPWIDKENISTSTTNWLIPLADLFAATDPATYNAIRAIAVPQVGDTDSAQQRHTHSQESQHGRTLQFPLSQLRALSWSSSDGRVVAFSGDTVSYHSIDPVTGDHTTIPHPNLSDRLLPVAAAAISPDGKQVVFRTRTEFIHWDTERQQIHADTVNGYFLYDYPNFEFSPDGTRILEVQDDGLWSILTLPPDSHRPFGQLSASPYPFVIRPRATFSHDGTRVATTSYDALQIWDSSSGKKILGPIKFSSAAALSGFAFHPDANHIFAVCGKTIQVWDVQAGAVLKEFGNTTDEYYCIACSPDGALVATGTSGGDVILWFANNCMRVREPLREPGTLGAVQKVVFSPDSGRLAAHIAQPGKTSHLVIWSV